MNSKKKAIKNTFSVLAFIFWAALILLCLKYKDRFNVETLSSLIPPASWTSVFVLMVLFAFKSITIVFYSGILYAVSGLIFPLPIALAVNIAGSALMISIPYFIGKAAGYNALLKLNEKYPKLSMIRDIQNESQILTCALARLMHVLPSDPVSLYFGASGVGFLSHLIGSLIGLTPMYVCFAIMGTSISDPTSPLFIGSVIFQLFFIALSVPLYSYLYKRKKRSDDSFYQS